MNRVNDLGFKSKEDIVPEKAEIKLDLCNLPKDDAVKQVKKMIEDCQKGSVETLYISFAPASPTSGETLFQPVGQIVRQAKQDKVIKYSFPVLQEDVAGFYVVFNL